MQQIPKTVGIQNNFSCDGCSYFWLVGTREKLPLTSLIDVVLENTRFRFCIHCARHRNHLVEYRKFEDCPTNVLLWGMIIVNAQNFSCLSCQDVYKYHRLSDHPLGLVVMKQYVHDSCLRLCVRCFSTQLVSGIRWI